MKYEVTNPENYRLLSRLIKKHGGDIWKLKRLERSIERVYNCGQLSPREFSRLDTMVFTRICKLEA